MSLLVKGGHIIDPANGIDHKMDMLVSEGRIARLETNIISQEGDQVIDADGMLVLPGLVDIHAHFGEPGREDRETISTGTLAAARGGFTTVLMMPDTQPPLDAPALVTQVLSMAEKQGHIRVRVAGALTKELAGNEMTEMSALMQAGATFLAQPDGPVLHFALLRNILRYARNLVPFIAIQPHDLSLTNGIMHEGVDSTTLGMPGIPASAEELAVAAAIILARETNCRLHLSRLSTAQSIALVAAAKNEGVPISCDVSAHHLTLTAKAFATYDPSCKLLPPLRTADDVAALIQAVASGVVDCIATDHTPLTQEENDVELSQAPYGASGIETAFAQLYTGLVLTGKLSISQLVAALTIRPAQLLGLMQTGALTCGLPADFTLVDPQAQITVDPANLISLGKNTPLTGRKLTGWPVATFVGGELAWPKETEDTTWRGILPIVCC